MICSVRATGGGGSIVAEMPDAGNLHLGDRLSGQDRPGQCPRPARRFATFHGLWGLDEVVLALAAAATTDSHSPLGASANIAGVVVASGKQRVFVRVVAFSELSKPRWCGSQPICDAMAASSSEAVMVAHMALKHPQRRQAAPDQATVPTSAGAPRPPQSGQLFRRRTGKTELALCRTIPNAPPVR